MYATSEAGPDPAVQLARIAADLAALGHVLVHAQAPAPEPPSPPRLMLTVEEAGDLLSLSRSATYDLIKAGHLRSVKIGGRRRVPRAALEDYVAGLDRRAAAPSRTRAGDSRSLANDLGGRAASRRCPAVDPLRIPHRPRPPGTARQDQAGQAHSGEGRAAVGCAPDRRALGRLSPARSAHALGGLDRRGEPGLGCPQCGQVGADAGGPDTGRDAPRRMEHTRDGSFVIPVLCRSVSPSETVQFSPGLKAWTDTPCSGRRLPRRVVRTLAESLSTLHRFAE